MIISRSLWRRIAVAAVAIAAIHVAFWAIPRWRATRPQAYPQAYERAVAALKAEFGAAAVEKGVISIPRELIAVPYTGRLLVASKSAGACYLELKGSYAHLVACANRKPAVGVRLTAAGARELWAVFAYLYGTRATCEGPLPPQHKVYMGAFVSEDRTWPTGRRMLVDEDRYFASSGSCWTRSGRRHAPKPLRPSRLMHTQGARR